MIKSYKSDYPNQVHQFTISVSKHFYLTKSGILKYQNKKLDATLKTIESSTKIHIVYYLIRDHTSGLFYAELTTSDKLIEPLNFLYRAWSKKEELVFCGMPKMILVPKTIQLFSPNICQILESNQVEKVNVTSGFQNGIGNITNIEKIIQSYIGKPVTDFYVAAILACKLNAEKTLRNTKITKTECWVKNIQKIKLPPVQWEKNLISSFVSEPSMNSTTEHSNCP